MKRLYILILVVAAAIIGGVIIGLNLYNKPIPETSKMKADATVDIATITSDFKTDSAKARKHYSGMKVIVLKGKASKILLADGYYHVNFNANNVNIDCLLEKAQNEKAATLKNDQEIQLKGKYSGFIFDEIIDPQPQLQLKDCILE